MSTYFISRHPGAIEWLAQQGVPVDVCLPHLEPAQIAPGDTVAGTLPVHLAAQVCAAGATYLHLSMELPAAWRGRELSAAELQACGARLQAFEVRPLSLSMKDTQP